MNLFRKKHAVPLDDFLKISRELQMERIANVEMAERVDQLQFQLHEARETMLAMARNLLTSAQCMDDTYRQERLGYHESNRRNFPVEQSGTKG